MLQQVQDSRPIQMLAATSDASMLEKTAAALAAATGARSAYIERFTLEPDVGEIVATFGPDAPHLGFGRRAQSASAHEFILPLQLDDVPIGAAVALDVPHTVVLNPALPGQLESLACIGALALRNLALTRELETANAAASERKFRVINGIVHYVKETLGAAAEYVQLLDTETELTARQQEFIRRSRRNIDDAVRLMSELLDLGRVETGRIRLEYEPVDVASVVRGMLRDYELANGVSGLTVERQFEPDLPRIRTDVDSLRRIVDSLVSNAVRYSPADGRITIAVGTRAGRRARDPKQWVCVAVTDQGPGIPEREQVFEEVARAEALASSPGFRLAISRRLSRLLGGDLTLETTDGRGSTFTLWLPGGTFDGTTASADAPSL